MSTIIYKINKNNYHHNPVYNYLQFTTKYYYKQNKYYTFIQV